MSELEQRARNPFYVVGVPVSATSVQIEREGQKLIAMLELGLSAAKTFSTPLGSRTRTKEDVRAALAELRDPKKRLVHELWARLPASMALELGDEDGRSDPSQGASSFADALKALRFE